MVIDICLQENAKDGRLESLVDASIRYWTEVRGYNTPTIFGAVRVFEGSNAGGAYEKNPPAKYDSLRYDRATTAVLVYTKPAGD